MADQKKDRLTFLREEHGEALLLAFSNDPRNEPFSAWIRDEAGETLENEAAADAVFKRYRGADPTPKAVHLQWLLRQALKGSLPAEDLDKARETLEAFQTYKRRLPADQRDLGRFDSLGTVWEAVEPLVSGGAATSANDEARREREEIRAESTILLERKNWTIAIPRTQRAAIWWGRGTRWCTAGTHYNYFQSYNSQGPLVVFVRPDGQKFQFHGHTRQFMDAADRRASPSELDDVIPLLDEHSPVLAAAIKGMKANPDGYRKRGGDQRILIQEPRPVSAPAPERPAPKRSWTRSLLAFLGLSGVAIKRSSPQPDGASNGVPCAEPTEDVVTETPAQTEIEKTETEALRIAKETWQAAMGEYGMPIWCAPPELWESRLFIEAVERDVNVLGHLPEEAVTPVLARIAVEKSGLALSMVPERIITPDLCRLAVEKTEQALAMTPSALRTPELVQIAMPGLLKSVSKDGTALRNIPPEAKTPKLCQLAIEQSGLAWRFVPEALRTPELKEMTTRYYEKAVTLDKSALRDAPDDILTADLCAIAVKANGRALAYVPKNLRSKALCLEAVKEHGRALCHVPEFLCDRAMFLAAVRQDGMVLDMVPETKRSREICLAAVYQVQSAIQFVPPHLANDPTFI